MAWTLTVKRSTLNWTIYEVEYVIHDDDGAIVERGRTTIPNDDTPSLASDRLRAILVARQIAMSLEPSSGDAGNPLRLEQVISIPARLKTLPPSG